VKRSNYIGAPGYYLLNQACRVVVEAFGFHLYLVGSAIERRDYRDVDLRLILPDDEFDALFPGLSSSPHLDARWSLMCTSISLLLSKASGLPVDFQVQRQTEANLDNPGAAARHPIGIFFEPRKP
jgi:hypothetical protein